ncbi:hypothetical protein PACTADRAFT_42436, partial [Pachysolen tannophilus NRRL Y-2460]
SLLVIMSNKNFFKSLKTEHVKDHELESYNGRYSEVIDLQWNSTGSRISYSKTDRSIRILKRSHDETENVLLIRNAHKSPVEKISWHPILEYTFATVAKDNEVKIWNSNFKNTTFECVKTIQLKNSNSRNIMCYYSPDGNYLAVIDKFNVITLIQAENYIEIISIKENSNIYDFCWTNTFNYFLAGLSNGKTFIYKFGPLDTKTNDLYEVHRIHELSNGNNSSITQVKFDPRGEFLITGASDGVISIYETLRFTCFATVYEVDEPISCIDISKDGTYFIVTFENGSAAKIYEVDGGSENLEIARCFVGLTTLPLAKFSPTKTTVAHTNGNDGSISVLYKGFEAVSRM